MGPGKADAESKDSLTYGQAMLSFGFSKASLSTFLIFRNSTREAIMEKLEVCSRGRTNEDGQKKKKKWGGAREAQPSGDEDRRSGGEGRSRGVASRESPVYT